MITWQEADRVQLRVFLNSPTGINLLRELQRARPSAVPHAFSDPSKLADGNVTNVAAHAYKAHGWEQCEEYLVGLIEEPQSNDEAAQKFQ